MRARYQAGRHWGVMTQTFKDGEFDRVWEVDSFEEALIEAARNEFGGRPNKIAYIDIPEWQELNNQDLQRMVTSAPDGRIEPPIETASLHEEAAQEDVSAPVIPAPEVAAMPEPEAAPAPAVASPDPDDEGLDDDVSSQPIPVQMDVVAPGHVTTDSIPIQVVPTFTVQER